MPQIIVLLRHLLAQVIHFYITALHPRLTTLFAGIYSHCFKVWTVQSILRKLQRNENPFKFKSVRWKEDKTNE